MSSPAESAISKALRRPSRRLREWLPDALALAVAFGWAVLAALLASIAACGGGGGVGTEGTGSFALGSISGFGSIVVNGVHYELPASTTIENDDGQAIDSATLQLGTMVQVRAGAVTVDADGISRATASDVHAVRSLVGAVSAVDAAHARLTVLGQVVAAAADTVFGDGWTGGVAAIAVGQWVEVYGNYDSGVGAIQATRIAPAGSGATAMLRAPVGTIDSTARTFTVGSQTYSYAAVTDPSGLAAGEVIRLSLGSSLDAKGRWVVGSAQSPVDAAPAAAAVDLRGTISSMSAATRFRIDNRAIDASAARIDAGLRVGASVRVTGTLVNGTVIASRVELQSSGSSQTFELMGPLTAVDAAAHRFVVRGTTVSWTEGATVFDKGSASDLQVGRSVRVDGVLADDGQTLRATLVRFGSS